MSEKPRNEDAQTPEYWVSGLFVYGFLFRLGFFNSSTTSDV